MIAGDYKLTAQVQARGDKLATELVISGVRDAENFHGVTLSFGGPSLMNLWEYRAAAPPTATAGKHALSGSGWHSLEVVRRDDSIRVSVDGNVEFELKDPRHRRRTRPSLWMAGEGAELRVKDLKIEAL